MKGHQQQVRTAVPAAVGLYAVRQGADIGVVVVIVVDETQFRQPAFRLERRCHGIERGGRGGGRVLRVQGQHEDMRRTAPPEPRQAAGNGGIAVAHGQFHRHRQFRERGLQRLRLADGNGQERRPLLPPDLGIVFGLAPWAGIQDHAVQYRPPQNPWQFHHPGVAEKLLQETPDGARRRIGGGAQIRQQDADGCRGGMVEIRGLGHSAVPMPGKGLL